MGSLIRSKFGIKSMISILRIRMPSIEWRMGDSDNLYYGYYVLGQTRNGIKIKIIEEDDPGIYYLGIYFYGTKHPFSPEQELKVGAKLQHRIMRAIAAKECSH